MAELLKWWLNQEAGTIGASETRLQRPQAAPCPDVFTAFENIAASWGSSFQTHLLVEAIFV